LRLGLQTCVLTVRSGLGRSVSGCPRPRLAWLSAGMSHACPGDDGELRHERLLLNRIASFATRWSLRHVVGIVLLATAPSTLRLHASSCQHGSSGHWPGPHCRRLRVQTLSNEDAESTLPSLRARSCQQDQNMYRRDVRAT
jgi:hypothetical protein